MTLKLALGGGDEPGWVWSVQAEGEVLFETQPLQRADLDLQLFEIQRDPDRINPLFDDTSDSELFTLFVGFFATGGLRAALHEVAEEQTWAKHVVSTDGPQRVPNFLFLFGGARSRLLVGTPERGLLKVISPAHDFDAQLSACRQQLRKE